MTAQSEAQGLPRVASGWCAYCHGPVRDDGVREGRDVVHVHHLDLWRSWLRRPAEQQ